MSSESNQTRGPLPKPVVVSSREFNIVGVPRHTIEGLRSTLDLDVYQRLLLDEAGYAKQTVQQVLVGVLTRNPQLSEPELQALADKTVCVAMYAFGSIVSEYGVRDR